jgi:hypothetical protein
MFHTAECVTMLLCHVRRAAKFGVDYKEPGKVCAGRQAGSLTNLPCLGL